MKTICLFIALTTSLLSLAQQRNDEFKWPNGNKLAVSLTFDDARLSQLENGIPILDKHNVKGTFYILPTAAEMRPEGWMAAAKNGHELGNHSIQHPCSGNFEWSRKKAIEDYSLEQMSAELQKSNDYIKDKLGVHVYSYAYPCGQTFVGKGKETKSLVPLVSSMFESGRLWNSETANDPSFCDMSQLNGSALDNITFKEAIALIKEAEKKGGWLIFGSHEVSPKEGGYTTNTETLDSLCAYLKDSKNKIWAESVHKISSYIKTQRNEVPFSGMLPYQNTALPTEERIDDLISRMTVKEKIGQLNCVFGMPGKQLGYTVEERLEGSRNFVKGTQNESIGPVGGFFALSNHLMHNGPKEQAEIYNEMQRLALSENRLKIPLLTTEEGTHGVMAAGATIFPEGPALGSTWNRDLIRRVYETTAKEGRAVGIHQLFTLVIEPIRDPRMGRNQEGYSEDPYMCAEYTREIVRGMQGYDVSRPDKVVAGLCHFPGQSEPVSGLERGAMNISERTLREVFLPPWVVGVKEAGALGVMATYPTIDGIPVHSSKEILTGILREELGFEGVVLSEGNGVNTLQYTGRVETLKEAAAMSAIAGMDLSIFFNQAYMKEMVENVEEGKVSVETIDRSVRYMLRQKFELGLFDNVIVNPEKAEEIVHHPGHIDLALQAAHESIVLLKNEKNLLPLKKIPKSIAVIGPNADHIKNQLGDYTSDSIIQPVSTVLRGLKDFTKGESKITYVKGCDVLNTSYDEIEKAVEAAKKSSIAIVVLGENEWQSKDKTGTTGEAFDVATLELTGRQLELLQKVHATGTPVIAVLINGRALAVEWMDKNIPAIIEAWNPGERGGEALADIIFGKVNPSGKLPVTFPRHVGQLPVYYNHLPSKPYWFNEGWGKSYADLENSKPLYPFGYGLSYTDFEYADLKISKEEMFKYDKLTVSCTIKNIGKVKGKETVQLYIRDKISSVVRPVKELKGFEKVELDPGESKEVTFELGFDHLKMLDKHLDWVVEPGAFQVMIGASSEDIKLEGTFEIID